MEEIFEKAQAIFEAGGESAGKVIVESCLLAYEDGYRQGYNRGAVEGVIVGVTMTISIGLAARDIYRLRKLQAEQQIEKPSN